MLKRNKERKKERKKDRRKERKKEGRKERKKERTKINASLPALNAIGCRDKLGPIYYEEPWCYGQDIMSHVRIHYWKHYVKSCSKFLTSGEGVFQWSVQEKGMSSVF